MTFTQPKKTLIYRIKADWPRSPAALKSHEGLNIIDIEPVKIVKTDQANRENGATAVHKKVMKIFLETDADFCVVLEDDAILTGHNEWLNFNNFDFFIPFAHNRLHLEVDLTIRNGKLPKYGAFAYLCSRQFAERYIDLLERGGLADVVSHKAAKGLRFGSFAGNAVNHDNEAPSMISEARRQQFLLKHPSQKKQPWWKRLLRL
jgi:hypothetical protein